MFTINIDNKEKHPIIELKDATTKSLVEIFAFGAILNKFIFRIDDEEFNVIDGYENLDEAINPKEAWFKSCKLTPFVCRLNNGKYSFNEKDYTIEKFYLAKHAIHGIVYDALYNIVATETNDDFALVALQYEYLGEDTGYPFPFSIHVIWKLNKENTLTVTTSVTHQNQFAIPFCDGWHPYFKLDVSVDDCTIRLNSNQQVAFDDALIPTGEIISDERFIKTASLKNITLDNCFKLNNTVDANCIVKGNLLSLQISSNHNYPYLQIYTPPHRKSIAIENLSAAPDAFNNKMGLLYIESNKEYEFVATYQLKSIL